MIVKGKRKSTGFGVLIASVLLAAVVFGVSLRNNGIMQAASCGEKFLSSEESGAYKYEAEAYFNGRRVSTLAELPSSDLALARDERVLGEMSEKEKWIEVDLTNQRIKAHEGDGVVYDFPMSSGKFVETPTGEYRIWSKFKYTKMEGGVKGTGTYYYLPNVPYTMFFHQGFGIHGTYWHNNFGHPMSHGCVNVSIPDAETLFYWAGPEIDPNINSISASKDKPGARVVVHGKTPKD